jgi:4-aminobutyrate aminotransferase-like enzyme
MGRRLAAGIERSAAENPVVREVRSLGLLLGVDLTIEASSVSTACRERGLLLNAVRRGTLRLAPPLTVSASEVDAALLILQEVLAKASAGDLHAN